MQQKDSVQQKKKKKENNYFIFFFLKGLRHQDIERDFIQNHYENFWAS